MRLEIAFLAAVLAIACGSSKQPEGEGSGGSSGSGSARPAIVCFADEKTTDPVARAQDCDKRCNADDLEACRNLGLLYLDGKGVPEDRRRSTALLVKACNGNNLPACGNLALAFSEGFGVDKDPAKAAELFEKACGGGHGLSCRSLGLMLRDGRGVAADLAKAESLLDRACNMGAPGACTNAADLDAMLLKDTGSGSGSGSAGSAPRVKKMIDHWTKGCNAGEPVACRSIGVAYLHGKWLPRSPTTAYLWLEKGARGNDAIAIRFVGMMKYDGNGTAQDAKRGAELIKRACAMQDEEACRAEKQLGAAGNGSGSGGSGSGVRGSGSM